ncbi:MULTISPECIES: hypothetical protein [unclassified Brevundimonas]|uniref:hypothetical protein n=1 Tax=unclassified Brevundimonas TaxID=2622653 RepID=UPI0025BAB605|nr:MULTISPECIES: hypothetical protein [unclassified Brevundimonas]
MEVLSSRLFISFYHTWRLKDELRLQDGGTTLDLLDGSGLSFRGGSRRHKLELQAGAFRRGLGARVSAVWQSGSETNGFGSPDDALDFSDLTSLNLSLFANLAEQFRGTGAADLLKGARATLKIDNLLNSRIELRDGAGRTPLNYQSAYFDPLGRTVTFEIRKIF